MNPGLNAKERQTHIAMAYVILVDLHVIGQYGQVIIVRIAHVGSGGNWHATMDMNGITTVKMFLRAQFN